MNKASKISDKNLNHSSARLGVPSMMSLSNFWKDFTFPSAVDDILKRIEGFTLEDLLNEDEVVTDARNHKLMLINYLSKPEVVTQLVEYVTEPPKHPDDEKYRYRYPHMAADLLAVDVPEITRLLYSGEQKLIDRLYGVLQQDDPDSLLLLHTCRVLAALFTSNTRLAIDHVKTKPNPLDIFLKHLDSSAVYDFFTKIIISDNAESIKMCLQFLIDEQFTEKLVTMLDKNSTKYHSDAVSLLTELITATGGLLSPMAQQLQSQEIASKLFEVMLQEGNNSGLRYGLTLVTFIINLIANSDPENDKTDGLVPIVQLSIDSLAQFKNILLGNDPNIGPALPPGVQRPFGSVRLSIVELVEALVKLEIDAVDTALLEHDMFTSILQLFMEYHSNDFLSKLVENIVFHILDGTSSELADSLFTKSSILEKIIAIEEANRAVEQNGHRRRSNVAYALNIADKINSLASAKGSIQQHLQACPAWESFVNGPLKQKKESEAVMLGGAKPIRTEIPGGGEFGTAGADLTGSNVYSEMSNMYIDDDEGSNSDEDEGSEDENSSDEDEEDDDNLDLADDADMDSEQDLRDFDSDRCEVLISKLEIESLLEVA